MCHQWYCVAHNSGTFSDIINASHFSIPAMPSRIAHYQTYSRWYVTHTSVPPTASILACYTYKHAIHPTPHTCLHVIHANTPRMPSTPITLARIAYYPWNHARQTTHSSMLPAPLTQGQITYHLPNSCEAKEAGSSKTCSCPKCRNYRQCKDYERVRIMSIKEKVEQDNLNHSVQVDTENCRNPTKF